MREDLQAIQRLSDILDTLRRQCPWDRRQTIKSLRYLTVEEVHELSEAIVEIENHKSQPDTSASAPARDGMEPAPRADDSRFSTLTSQFKKELGDLAMHILFYCKLAEDEGLFTTADVYNAICDKLVSRHPFIYDKENYHGENWEQLKMREGRRNVLEGVPSSLPTLIKTLRLQEKVYPAPDKEAPEGAAVNGYDPESITEEQFGQRLFDLVDWGRRHGLNADDALAAANLRFAGRHSRPEGTL